MRIAIPHVMLYFYSDPNYKLGISSLVMGVNLGFGSLRTLEG
jgi:hypothetical protein